MITVLWHITQLIYTYTHTSHTLYTLNYICDFFWHCYAHTNMCTSCPSYQSVQSKQTLCSSSSATLQWLLYCIDSVCVCPSPLIATSSVHTCLWYLKWYSIYVCWLFSTGWYQSLTSTNRPPHIDISLQCVTLPPLVFTNVWLQVRVPPV